MTYLTFSNYCNLNIYGSSIPTGQDIFETDLDSKRKSARFWVLLISFRTTQTAFTVITVISSNCGEPS